ncbi:zf-C3HC-domain-containing protein [Dendrothele bispora CBS 962.96]|uniref:Zf-C3HC-domain-containing protein n=1 Tax=Dendrothele bispora (strain CBS 962.96) TaxID=1314807 RepID=A0A4S8MK63_DENBC|nr:zf-C3HC-domain-containing protein [Dendrothele bispora CBS 962.96]
MGSDDSHPPQLHIATKRKLDDAFSTLDDAVRSNDQLEPSTQPPPKKPFTSRSFYSTLAKYGIKSNDSESPKTGPSLPKHTPHLSAILSRAATRTRKAMPFKFERSEGSSVPLSPLVDYRPSSITSFLARLSTFKLSTYANKPSAIDAVAAAKCGWINDGKDRLVCGICDVSWVVVGKERMTRDAANALIEKQRISLSENHKKGCPWRTRQCDASIYRIPLQSSTIMARDIRQNALAIDILLQDIEIRHPLTANQISSLQSAISSFEHSPSGQLPSDSSSAEPCTNAILASLFGWSLVTERSPVSALSRSTSQLSSPSTTPSLSRASSVPPGAGHPRPLLRVMASKVLTQDSSLLQCRLCQRRVGLWAFAPPKESAAPGMPAQSSKQRPFDLLKEHRSYCPYVVRSTVVPSLPTNASASQLNGTVHGNGALEGWKAVLTVLLRHGIAQRHQLGWQPLQDRMDANTGGEVMDEVQAMVQGVKSRGGKDLLRYVKSLLG